MTKCEKPTWLTQEFVQKAIENGKKSYEVIVESFDVDTPVAAGNNYGSDIFGVKAKYRRSNDLNNLHEISLILKGQENGALSELAEEIGATDKEAIAYKELAPRLKALLDNEQNDDSDSNVLPNSYFSIMPNVIILEDLKIKGYEMVDKINQLDYDQSVEAIKALAKFHAGSVIIQQNEPEVIEKLSKEVMYTTVLQGVFANIMKTNFKIMADECRQRPSLQKYSKWFEENSETWENIVETIKAKENELKVLVHGNYWLTNMLFKNSENEKPKVKILDLQTLRYSSPVLDFLELMEASVQEEVRTEKFDELIHIYLQVFNSLLEQKGCSQRLSESEFKKSIADRPFYRIFIALFSLPFILADPKEVKILDRKEFSLEIFGEIEKTPMVDYMKKGKFMEIISKRLEEYEKNGIITAE